MPSNKTLWHFEIGKIYLVHWLDHWTYAGWHDPDLPNDQAENCCMSIGICTYNADDIVHLSTTCSNENLDQIEHSQVTSTMGVLKNCIQRAWELQGAT